MLIYESLFVLITTLSDAVCVIVSWADSLVTEGHQVNPRKEEKQSVRNDSGMDDAFSCYVLGIWAFEIIIKV